MGLAAIALVAPVGVSDNAVGGDADIAGAVKATTAAVLVGGAAGLVLPLVSLSSAAVAPSLLFCRMYLLCQIGSTTSTMAWF